MLNFRTTIFEILFHFLFLIGFQDGYYYYFIIIHAEYFNQIFRLSDEKITWKDFY